MRITPRQRRRQRLARFVAITLLKRKAHSRSVLKLLWDELHHYR